MIILIQSEVIRSEVHSQDNTFKQVYKLKSSHSRSSMITRGKVKMESSSNDRQL